MWQSGNTDCVVRPSSAPAELLSKAATTQINNDNNNVKTHITTTTPIDSGTVDHTSASLPRYNNNVNDNYDQNLLASDLKKEDKTNDRLRSKSLETQRTNDKVRLASLPTELPSSDVEVSNETAIVSIVNGVIRSTGEHQIVYKCHLCCVFCTTLTSLGRHMSSHEDTCRSMLQQRSAQSRATLYGNCDQPITDVPILHRSLSERWSPAETNEVVDFTVDKSTLQKDKCNGLIKCSTTNVNNIPPAVKMSNASTTNDICSSPIIGQNASQSGINVSTAAVLHNNNNNNNNNDLLRSGGQRRLRPFGARRRATTDTLQCRRPSQRLAFVTSEMLAGEDLRRYSNTATTVVTTATTVPALDTRTSHEMVGELTKEIRAKEHLDDDVTVVIPSDAPLDAVARHGMVTGGNTASWAVDSDDVSVKLEDGDKKIAHAPVKSIMGHTHMQRKARHSVSGTTESAATNNNTEEPMAVETSCASALSAQQLSLLNVAAESLQFPGGLPAAMFGPLALSTFVHGFGGLVAASSPLLSYYAQLPSAASLASLMALTGTPLVTAASMCGNTSNMVDDGGKVTDRPTEDSASDPPPTDGAAAALVEETSNGSGSNGWTSDPLTSGFASPNIKCSSLSRTHSRLNVVRRPIKREDACRPVVLSDGRTAFRCFYCKKDFCTISDVNRHMDFHEDIRPYKCRFCNYYARTNSQLKVHMMRHQGIREYMCRLCNYKGVTQSDLNRHTKSQIHLMKARNECMQCAEGFVSPLNLEQHQHDKHQP